MTILFSGLWVPLVTPFRHGAPDLPAVQRLVERYARAGCRGVVVAGTTGEASALTDDEKARLLDAVLEVASQPSPSSVSAPARGRLGVLMGLGGTGSAPVLAEARRFEDRAIDGWLVAPPCYVRPSQQGIQRHYEALAAITGHPIVLYDNPARTGVVTELDTVRRLAEQPRFVAIKESSGSVARLQALVEQTPLAVLCGEDALLFVAGCLGAHGAIAAAAHLRPELYVAMLQALHEGDLARARRLNRALTPLTALLFAEPSPAPVKAALALDGLLHEELRLPLTEASGALREQLRDALAGLQAVAA